MPFRMGPVEIGLIVLVILIVFGPGRLPHVGEAIGKSIRSFRKATSKESDTEQGEKS